MNNDESNKPRLEMLPCWYCGDTELDGGCYPCGGPPHTFSWWRCTCGNPYCYARAGIESKTREQAITLWNEHPYRALKSEVIELRKRIIGYEKWERGINEALNSVSTMNNNLYPPFKFTAQEIEWLQKIPDVLKIVADGHEFLSSEAEAGGYIESSKYHELRAQVLVIQAELIEKNKCIKLKD